MFTESDPLCALFQAALRPIAADLKRNSRDDADHLSGGQTCISSPASFEHGGGDVDTVVDVLLSGKVAGGQHSGPPSPARDASSYSPKSPYHASAVSLALVRARVAMLRLSSQTSSSGGSIAADGETRQWKAFANAIHYAASRAVTGSGPLQSTIDIDDDVLDAEYSPAQYDALALWSVSRTSGSQPRKFASHPIRAICASGEGGADSAGSYASPLRSEHVLKAASPRFASSSLSTQSPNHHHTSHALNTSNRDDGTPSFHNNSSSASPQRPTSVQVCGVQVTLNHRGVIEKAHVRDALNRLGYTAAILDDETFSILFKDTDADEDDALTEGELATLLASFGEDNV